MIILKKGYFDAAHFLPDHPKCGKVHGHRWTVEIGVMGRLNPDTGMVVDFHNLSSFLNEEVLEKFDHKLINDIIPNPTAELIAGYIGKKLNLWCIGNNIEPHVVRIWETPDSCVELYSGSN